MNGHQRNPSREAIRALARELAGGAVRAIAVHALAAVLLFSLAAWWTCRLAFDPPGGSSLLRGLGKTGVYTLYLVAGMLAGSLHGAASAVLGRIDSIRDRVAEILDAGLVGEIPVEKAAESMHAFRLQWKEKLGGLPGLRLLRALPVAGTLVRSLETLGSGGEDVGDVRGRLARQMVGTVVDDVRRQGNRARALAFLLATVMLAVPVVLSVIRG